MEDSLFAPIMVLLVIFTSMFLFGYLFYNYLIKKGKSEFQASAISGIIGSIFAISGFFYIANVPYIAWIPILIICNIAGFVGYILNKLVSKLYKR